MPLRLSDRDLSALTAAMTVMLTPFCYEDGEQWRSTICDSLPGALHSNGATFTLALPNEPVHAGPADMVSALQALLPPPDWLLKGFERRKQLGLNVAGFSDLHDVKAVKRTPFYNDVVIPNRMLSPLVLAADFPGLTLPAVLGFCFEDERKAAEHLARNKQMLTLLVPAFLAGVGTYVQLNRQRAAFASVLDSISAGVTIVDVDGAVVGENHALKALLRDDAERERIRSAIKHVARGVASVVGRGRSPDWETHSNTSTVCTALAHYRTTATFVPEGLLHHRDTVLALTERVAARPSNSQQFSTRFGLTHREMETAQLMMRGYSNRQVALALGISVNTARRHAEHVLAKLGVHSRAAVAAQISGVS